MKILKKITVIAYEKVSIGTNDDNQEEIPMHSRNSNPTSRTRRADSVDSRAKFSPVSKMRPGGKIKVRAKVNHAASRGGCPRGKTSVNSMKTKSENLKDKKNVKNPQAPRGREFQVSGEPLIKDLKQLYLSLDKIGKDQFDHHTKRKDGNDFANWIENALQEKELAQTVAKMNTRKGLKRALELYFNE
ncbi:MAG: hypothetical protein R6V40_02235 [Candidatus Moraniibacteriota bacterium]